MSLESSGHDLAARIASEINAVRGEATVRVNVLTGDETRPNAGFVIWLGGETQPTNMQDGDLWMSATSVTVTVVSIITTSLNSMIQSTAFTQTLDATGTTPITWAVTTGTLPSGLTLNEENGTISGTPSSSGAYSFTVTATNAGGTDTQAFSGTVTASATAPTITTTTIAAMTVNSVYTQAMDATGSTPITWGVSAGTLPAGLGINSTTGALSGTPTTAGAYSFTVQATNSAGSDTQAFSGTVAAASGGTAKSIFGTANPGTTTVFNDGGGTIRTGAAFYATKSIRVLGLRIWNPAGAAAPFLSASGTAYAYTRDWTGTDFTSAPTWASPTATKAFSGTRTAGTWTDVLFDTPIVLNAIASGANSPDNIVLAVGYAAGDYYTVVADMANAEIVSTQEPGVYLAEKSFRRGYHNLGSGWNDTFYGIDMIFEVV